MKPGDVARPAGNMKMQQARKGNFNVRQLSSGGGVLQVVLSAEGEEDVARSINARLLSSGLARYAAPRRKVTPSQITLSSSPGCEQLAVVFVTPGSLFDNTESVMCLEGRP